MWNEIVKSLDEAKFLLEASGKVLPSTKAGNSSRIETRLQKLLEKLDSIPENSKSGKKKEVTLYEVNEWFNTRFHRGSHITEREKILDQLNEYRRKGKSTSIRVRGSEMQELIKIQNSSEDFTSCADVVKELLKVYRKAETEKKAKKAKKVK